MKNKYFFIKIILLTIIIQNIVNIILNIKDFSVSGLLDEEEEELSQENFLMISLENQFRVAVRPSGTEPKIKFYIFGESQPNSTNLVKTKEQVASIADELGAYLVEDAKERAN